LDTVGGPSGHSKKQMVILSPKGFFIDTVVEKSNEGKESKALQIQMATRKMRAHVLDILGFRGRTMAMYLW
jgi:hypothetical protein